MSASLEKSAGCGRDDRAVFGACRVPCARRMYSRASSSPVTVGRWTLPGRSAPWHHGLGENDHGRMRGPELRQPYHLCSLIHHEPSSSVSVRGTGRAE